MKTKCTNPRSSWRSEREKRVNCTAAESEQVYRFAENRELYYALAHWHGATKKMMHFFLKERMLRFGCRGLAENDVSSRKGAQ